MEDPNKITYFAKTNTRGKETPFGIKRKDRARHMYVIGKTGMGKSTLLENMAIQDIRNGEGIAFIDPHGATADRILEYVPPHRVQDVLYFAPFDMDFPVAFNVMEDVGYDKRHLVVSGLLSAFRKIWVDAWSARMEYILSNTLLALLEYPNSTLLDVNRMLVDRNFRKKVVENTQDPIVKSFWVDEFATYTDRYTQEATPAIQNKVGQFTSNPLIRNIVGQPKSTFDLRRLMDEKKIIIMNLSKGRVGEVNATLLGSMFVTKLYLSAMSRADVPASVLDVLPNFYFYVDEFQNFANQSFADILSEARKYKLNLIIAHQYIEQMEEEVRDAVFGNVGTTVSFRVGPFDAETLETIFQPQFTQEDLVNLGFAQIYLTLMIDGVGSPPFSAQTLPPFDPSPQNLSEQVKESSRAAYGKLRDVVEASIAQSMAPEASSARGYGEPKPPPSARRSESGGGRKEGESRESSAPRPNMSRNGSSAAPRNYERVSTLENERKPVRDDRANREEHPHREPPNHQRDTQPRENPRKDYSRSEFSESNNRPTHAPRRNPEPYRQEERKIEAPPGIHSLKEAIAQATGQKPEGDQLSQAVNRNVPPKAEAAHNPVDLKAILAAIAPPPQQKNISAPPSRPTVQVQPARLEVEPIKEKHQPAGIPDGELHEMLKVEGVDE